MSDAPSARLATMWGERLRAARLAAGKTQTEFGEPIGRDQTSISRFERGEGAWTPEAMLAFAIALDTRVESLFPWPIGLEDAERFHRMTASKKAS